MIQFSATRISQLFHGTTAALLLALLCGCSSTRKPDYHQVAAPPTEQSLQQTGVEIGVDPFVETERSRAYFGVDAVGDGIAILHVRLRNMTPDQTFLVEKKNFHLTLRDAAADQTADKVNRNSSGGEAVAWLGAAGGSLPLLLVGASFVAKATEVQRNFMGKEMPDQTLSPGQNMEGFIYFNPVPKGKNWSQGALMKVDLLETSSRQTTKLSLALSR